MGSTEKNEGKLGHFTSAAAPTLAANVKAKTKIQRICEIISKWKWENTANDGKTAQVANCRRTLHAP